MAKLLRTAERTELTFWLRARYTMAIGVLVTVILMLTSALLLAFVPSIDLFTFFLSPKVWFLLVPLYVVAWIAVPYVRERMPLNRFGRS